MKKILEIVLICFVIIFLFSLFTLMIQVVGNDSSNKATILSGLLSMIGGAAGAFSAYFIARWQMDKQLDLQYKKEKEKIIVELKINKTNEIINIYNDVLNEIASFEEKWINLQSFVNKKRKYLGSGVFALSDFIDEKCSNEVLYSKRFVINRYHDVLKYQIYFPNRKEIIKSVYNNQMSKLDKITKSVANMDFYYNEVIIDAHFDARWREFITDMNCTLSDIKKHIEKEIMELEKEINIMFGVS